MTGMIVDQKHYPRISISTVTVIYSTSQICGSLKTEYSYSMEKVDKIGAVATPAFSKECEIFTSISR